MKNTSGTRYADAYIPRKLLRTPFHKLSFLADSSISFRHKLRHSPDFTETKIYLAREYLDFENEELKLKNKPAILRYFSSQINPLDYQHLSN